MGDTSAASAAVAVWRGFAIKKNRGQGKRGLGDGNPMKTLCSLFMVHPFFLRTSDIVNLLPPMHWQAYVISTHQSKTPALFPCHQASNQSKNNKKVILACIFQSLVAQLAYLYHTIPVGLGLPCFQSNWCGVAW